MKLVADRVSKEFRTADRAVAVLTEVSFEAASGESIAVMGPSGSGKSTLLHAVGTLEAPSSGSVRYDDTDPYALSEPNMARFRNDHIGFVFQDHHLLPQYTVLENTLIPTLAYRRDSSAAERAHGLLERVGLDHRLDHRPAELSGGERQRVAIARALINAPGILLCDEPTGNLDQRTAESVADLLVELHTRENNLLIVVTHSHELAARFARRLELKEGKCFEH